MDPTPSGLDETRPVPPKDDRCQAAQQYQRREQLNPGRVRLRGRRTLIRRTGRGLFGFRQGDTHVGGKSRESGEKRASPRILRPGRLHV